LALTLGLGSPAGLAAELIELGVADEGGIYTVRLEMELDAAADHVQQILMNYRQLHRLNPSIVESHTLPSPDGKSARVYTRMETCVFFYCTGFSRVEDIVQSASGDLVAVIVPELSDFKTGRARWRIREKGARTLLVYEASMQPDFFITPLLGNYLVKKKLTHALLVSFNRIECCARSRLRASHQGSARETKPQTCL